MEVPVKNPTNGKNLSPTKEGTVKEKKK